MPAETVWACGDYARVLYLSFAREAMGAAGTRHSLRPLFSWANGFVRLGRITPRGANARRRHCEERLVRRSSTSEGGSDEAIQLLASRRNGLLRGACHRARIRATRWLAMAVQKPQLFAVWKL